MDGFEWTDVLAWPSSLFSLSGDGWTPPVDGVALFAHDDTGLRHLTFGSDDLIESVPRITMLLSTLQGLLEDPRARTWVEEHAEGLAPTRWALRFDSLETATAFSQEFQRALAANALEHGSTAPAEAGGASPLGLGEVLRQRAP